MGKPIVRWGRKATGPRAADRLQTNGWLVEGADRRVAKQR